MTLWISVLRKRNIRARNSKILKYIIFIYCESEYMALIQLGPKIQAHNSRFEIFVHPFHCNRVPFNKLFLFEPKGNFFLCWFNCIRSMTDILTDLNSKVPTDGTWCWGSRICFTKHYSTSPVKIEIFGFCVIRFRPLI